MITKGIIIKETDKAHLIELELSKPNYLNVETYQRWFPKKVVTDLSAGYFLIEEYFIKKVIGRLETEEEKEFSKMMLLADISSWKLPKEANDKLKEYHKEKERANKEYWDKYNKEHGIDRSEVLRERSERKKRGSYNYGDDPANWNASPGSWMGFSGQDFGIPNC